ncbi:4Fe-4S binding protein [Desulfobacterales bacterium HSG2]|nr:4Fe-4S binding protein [Desulfobacterales bacterium HSG2]
MTKQEAKEILDQSEEAGLVHMSRNTTEDVDFLCNCDRWHCDVVTQVLKQAKPGLIFNSGFHPSFNPELCTVCETCIERCPPEALTFRDNDAPVVNPDLCFGCAVCATGCPESAIEMESKPDFPTPPKNTGELVAALRSVSQNG